jgi:hypothetical protein
MRWKIDAEGIGELTRLVRRLVGERAKREVLELDHWRCRFV